MANPASSPSPPLSAALSHFTTTSSSSSIDSPWPRSAKFSPSRPLSSLAALQHFSDLRTTTKAASLPMQAPDFHPASARNCSCTKIEGFAPLTCEECLRGCSDAPCAVELGSECTDQCVVVACNDVHHSAVPCSVAPTNETCEPCESACPEGDDCTALEEFFQCCAQYHEYLQAPRPFSSDTVTGQNGLSWDPSFAAFLCACSDSAQFAHGQASGSSIGSMNSLTSTPQFGHAQASESSMSSVHSASMSPQLSPSPVFQPASESTVQPSPIMTHATSAPHAPNSQNNIAQYYPSPQSTHSPQPQSQPLMCQWGGCFASFASLEELVGHVNLQHLRLPSVSQPAPMIQAQQPSLDRDNGASALSCLWADCQVYPTPQSVPGPSTGNPDESILGILASHLLEDHLGLSTRSSMQKRAPGEAQASRADARPPVPIAHPFSVTSTFGASPSTEEFSAGSNIPQTHGPPTPLPEHDCSAPSAHVCRWMGCTETFVSCDELTAHITAKHVGAGRAHYDCYWEGCVRNGDSGFASKQKILRHLQSHTGHRPFQCKICNQNFSEAATLAQHMRRHTQEKPYICDFPGCGKAFAITGALTIHKRTHNGHKPFKCSYCDRAFAESSNLSKHLRTHTGARPYPCTEPGCSKSFARPDQLARHQNVHKKKQQADGAVPVAVEAM